MKNSFPLVCYTALRTCPAPDTNIRPEQFLNSPADINELSDDLARLLRQELKTLGRPPLRRARILKRRPSIECRILTYR